MAKELWSLDMPYAKFREVIQGIVEAENDGKKLGRITFDTNTKVISIGVEGTKPQMD